MNKRKNTNFSIDQLACDGDVLQAIDTLLTKHPDDCTIYIRGTVVQKDKEKARVEYTAQLNGSELNLVTLFTTVIENEPEMRKQLGITLK